MVQFLGRASQPPVAVDIVRSKKRRKAFTCYAWTSPHRQNRRCLRPFSPSGELHLPPAFQTQRRRQGHLKEEKCGLEPERSRQNSSRRGGRRLLRGLFPPAIHPAMPLQLMSTMGHLCRTGLLPKPKPEHCHRLPTGSPLSQLGRHPEGLPAWRLHCCLRPHPRGHELQQPARPILIVSTWARLHPCVWCCFAWRGTLRRHPS
mmetsp:Transcript_101124/g.182515  ORF Transcript_101124/g.182515 Transcript_101124/m.182515 type:complete len:203 (-) Transcript_101124:1175-1783(-)